MILHCSNRDKKLLGYFLAHKVSKITSVVSIPLVLYGRRCLVDIVATCHFDTIVVSIGSNRSSVASLATEVVALSVVVSVFVL